jgi:hypothetical protein
MITFAERLAEDRRLVILRCLSEAAGYQMNDQMLKKAVAFIGHQAATDIIRADVIWLADHGLVRMEKIAVTSGELWIVYLTTAGQEVSEGRYHPGVARRPAE